MSQLDRVRTLFTGSPGMPGVTTMYFDPSEGLNPTDLVARIRTFWDTFKNNLNNTLVINVEPIVDSVNSDTGEVTSSTGVTALAPVLGTSSADPIPWSSQGLIQLRTGVYFGGRELRGRYFIPAFTETDSTGGKPATSLVTQISGYAQSLADDADQVVYSPTKREFADVSTASLWTSWAVLRSRRD